MPFTDVSVLAESRVAPRYASNYSIDVREVSAGMAGSKEKFFNPPDENGVGWNRGQTTATGTLSPFGSPRDPRPVQCYFDRTLSLAETGQID